MPIEFCVLASGSEANAFWLATEQTKILIDCGLSCAQVERRLARIKRRPTDLTAILVTHEHGDHVGGLANVAGKYRVPIFLTEGTQEAIDGDIRHRAPEYEIIKENSYFRIGDVEGYSFPVQHNANEPVGFGFAAHGIRIGFATDLGSVVGCDARRIFPACDLIYLESNHEPEAVERGVYAPALKDRVKQDHLSNDDACRFIRDYLTTQTQRVILGHISRNNNDPELVRVMASGALLGRATGLTVAGPNEQTPLFNFN